MSRETPIIFYHGMAFLQLYCKVPHCIKRVRDARPEFRGKEMLLTDTAIYRIAREESVSCIPGEKLTMYHYDRAPSVQLFLDYLHGKVEETPSFVIYRHHRCKFPFSYDLQIAITNSLNMTLGLIHDSSIPCTTRLAFVSQYENEADLRNALDARTEIPLDLQIPDFANEKIHEFYRDEITLNSKLRKMVFGQ